MRLFLILVLLFIVGCATSQKGPSSLKVEGREVKSEVIDLVRANRNEVSSHCVETESEFVKLNKSQRMNAANACVTDRNWNAVEVIGHGWSKDDTSSPWGPYYLSLAAEAHNEFTRALWMIELALKRNNKTGLLLYQKGRLQWKLEDFNRALDTMSEAIKIDNKLTEAQLFLGEIYFRDQNFEKATGYFNVVLQLDSRNFNALVGLAECRLLKNDGKGFLELINRALDVNPRIVEVQMRKAYVLETKERDIEGALQVYKYLRGILNSQKKDLKSEIETRIKTLEGQLAKLQLAAKSPRVPASTKAPEKSSEKEKK